MNDDIEKENKGFFDSVFSLLIIGAIVTSLFFFFSKPEPVNKAEDILTLHYLNNDIYSPVNCRSEKVEDSYYIKCGPVPSNRHVPGGLYLVEFNDEGEYKIITVNGKAMTHSNTGYSLKSRLMLGRQDGTINVTKVLDSFY